MPSAAKHRGSLKEVSLKKAAVGLMSPRASSQCCDYWRLPSLICVIPIFSDSWVRALRGTTLSGSLPKPSCRKGSKSLLPQQLDAAWQLQFVSLHLYYCYLYLGVLMIAWLSNASCYVLHVQVWHNFSSWLNTYKKAQKNRDAMFHKHWLMYHKLHIRANIMAFALYSRHKRLQGC